MKLLRLTRFALLAFLAATAGWGLGATAATVAAAQIAGQRLVPLGYSECAADSKGNFAPIGWIRLDVVQSPHLDVVVAHELSHIEVMRRFESCQDYHRWNVELGNRRLNEALAHCAGATAGADRGSPVNHAEIGQRLATLYPDLDWTPAEAEAFFRGICP